MNYKENEGIRGVMRTLNKELPPKDAADAAAQEEMNESLKGLGVRTFRAATDWGYSKYEGMPSSVLKEARDNKRLAPKYLPNETREFQSGDLVTIFKSVSKGDVLWQGTIAFDRSDYHHGYQKNMSSTNWSSMFFDRIPARLVRDGKEIFGALEPFAETGSEGVIWAVSEYGKSGYEGLNFLEDGDELTVYSDVQDGEIEWQGTLDFTDVAPRPFSEKRQWIEIVREANHMDSERWLEMSYQNRPMIVMPKAGL